MTNSLARTNPDNSSTLLDVHALHQTTKHHLPYTSHFASHAQATALLELSHHAREDDFAHPCISLGEEIADSGRNTLTRHGDTLWRGQHAQHLGVAVDEDVAQTGKGGEEEA